MPRPKKSESPTETPTEKPDVEKVRKPRKKKEPTEVAEKPEPKLTTEKKKRVMSEKQLAALAKGRESLANKRVTSKSS